MNGPLPALRYVETVLIEHEGQPHICISDPSGLVEEQVLLSPHAYLVAACLDGENDVAAVQGLFATHANGAQVNEENILHVVEYLDGLGFLDSPRFEAIHEEAVRAYRDAPCRPAHLAGQSYPAEPGVLREFIARFFSDEGGPGALPEQHGGDAAPLRALVVPHIDFHRGAYAYAHGYKRLYEAGKPDTVIVFGVAHVTPPVPFVLTRKDFETPLGTLRVDTDLVDELAAACDWDPFAHELAHRNEHSIEFQAVMLAYLYGPDVRIVPVLCAAMYEETEEEEGGQRVCAGAERFLERCRELAADPARRVTVIAGADLAHVGVRFGDEFDIDDAVLAATARRDEEDLDAAMAGAPAAWYASVMKDENARRVCGLGCIYATLRAVEGGHGGGELLHYGYAPDPAGGIVSFASIRFP